MFQREPSDDDGMRSVVGNLTANVATSLTNMQVDFLRLTAPLTTFSACPVAIPLGPQLLFAPHHPIPLVLADGDATGNLFHVVASLPSIMSAFGGRQSIGRYQVETCAMLT